MVVCAFSGTFNHTLARSHKTPCMHTQADEAAPSAAAGADQPPTLTSPRQLHCRSSARSTEDMELDAGAQPRSANARKRGVSMRNEDPRCRSQSERPPQQQHTQVGWLHLHGVSRRRPVLPPMAGVLTLQASGSCAKALAVPLILGAGFLKSRCSVCALESATTTSTYSTPRSLAFPHSCAHRRGMMRKQGHAASHRPLQTTGVCSRMMEQARGGRGAHSCHHRVAHAHHAGPQAAHVVRLCPQRARSWTICL